MPDSHWRDHGGRNFGRFHLLPHSVCQGWGLEWLRGHFDKAWRVFGVVWWRTLRRHFMVLVADISFVSYLDTESLTDASRQPAGFVMILA